METNQANSKLAGLKYLLLAVGVLGLSIYLNLAKPLWLSPPAMRFTPFVYFLLTWAWLPVLVYALYHLIQRRRRIIIWLTMLIIIGQCCGAMVLAPIELVYLSLYGGKDPVMGGGLYCEAESAAPNLACQLCIVSSDSPPETIYTYHFKYWEMLPVMWLTDISVASRSEPGVVPCRGF